MHRMIIIDEKKNVSEPKCSKLKNIVKKIIQNSKKLYKWNMHIK